MRSGVLAEDLDHVLRYTRPLWEDLRGSSVFLTGGTGFVGCWLVETFLHANRQLDLGAQCYLLTRSPESFRLRRPHLAMAPAIHLIEGDVRDFVEPDGAFAFVIHAASDVGTAISDPASGLRISVDGTHRILEFARTHGARRFLLTSSGAIYGPRSPGEKSIYEDAPGAPDPMVAATGYGQGKRIAEWLCAHYAASNGLHTSVARCFAFAGPYLPDDGQYAFSSFVRSALAGDPIRLSGDGTPVRTYLYAADLAIWLWTILLRGEAGRAYNVGSENPVTIKELADEVASRISPPVAVRVGAASHTGRGSNRYVPCTRRAREELMLAEHIDWKEAIDRTARWHRQMAGPIIR
jgi:nucleoside-diphosphate-sugar epimerase